jgi:hypothetical protein
MQHGYAKLARGPDDFQACDPVEPCRGLPAMMQGGWRSILRAGRSDSDGNGLNVRQRHEAAPSSAWSAVACAQVVFMGIAPKKSLLVSSTTPMRNSYPTDLDSLVTDVGSISARYKSPAACRPCRRPFQDTAGPGTRAPLGATTMPASRSST